MQGAGPTPSQPAATNMPPPPGGMIPPPAPPNPPPASTNALGNTTPTATGTPNASITATATAAPDTGKKSLFEAIASGGKDMSADQVVFFILAVLWFGFGFAGFIMSLWCLGFSGNVGQKIGGLLFAIFLGPFYWVYFYSVPAYCARLPPPSALF